MNMKYKKLILPILTLLLLFITSGCTTTDIEKNSYIMGDLSNVPEDFILIGDDEYEGEFTIACAKFGIKIRPIASNQKVTEIESSTRMVEFNEAKKRYALKMKIKHDYGYVCVFSGGHFVDVTLSVIDIVENETVGIIKQRGPNMKCPPLTPVWDLLAEALFEELQ